MSFFYTKIPAATIRPLCYFFQNKSKNRAEILNNLFYLRPKKRNLAIFKNRLSKKKGGFFIMKKLIGTVVVAALLATTAFAEGLSFGAWNTGLFVVGNSSDGVDKNGVTSWVTQRWGAEAPRTSLAIKGDSENVGFALDIHGNGKTLDMGDNAFVWVKPIEWLKVSLAAKDDRNVLRTGACFGLYNFLRIGAVGKTNDDGFIFPAFLNKNVSAVATPIDGLTIGAGFNSPIQANAPLSTEGNRFVDHVGRSLGVAAAYTIADIGTIKAGLEAKGKGANKDGESKDLINIAAAFELTAVENVYVAVGAVIPVGGTYTSGSNANPIQIKAYGRLSMIENLTINITAGIGLNCADGKPGDAKADGAFAFGFGAEVEYALSNGITVFGDVRYANGILQSGSSADKADTLTFGAGLWKNYSNGDFGVAFEATTNGQSGRATIYDNALAWAVPVRWTVSF